jgi:hypothetical protein
MRVRISYSVELEEVPEQSAEILNETCRSLLHLSNLMKDLAIDVSRGTVDKETILRVVDTTRAAIGKVDSQLADTSMIMSGYHDAKKQILEEISNPRPQPEKESMVEVEGKDAV